jgi:hypothetical protein
MSTAPIHERAKEALDAGVIIGDGHTLFAPEYYEPHFTKDELIKACLIEKHKSDGTHKGTIFAPDGSIVEELEAVYNLHFLYWLAEQIGVTEYVRANGRGSQAQELVGYIREALAK